MRRRACAVGLVAVLALSACTSHDEAERLAPGEVVPDVLPHDGTGIAIVVPSQHVDLRMGEPTARIGASAAGLRAPDGGSLVPVTWSLNRHLDAPVTGFEAATRMTLKTSEREVEIAVIPDSPTDVLGGVVVALAEGEEVETIGVDYDGLEQTFAADGERSPSIADQLYEPSWSGQVQDCTDDFALADTPGLEPRTACEVRAWGVPYLPGEGWAEQGEVHLIVEPRLNLLQVRGEGEEYRTRFVSSSDTVDGQDGRGALELGTEGTGSVGGRLVATVPTDSDTPPEWASRMTFELIEHGVGPRLGDQVTLRGTTTLAPTT